MRYLLRALALSFSRDLPYNNSRLFYGISNLLGRSCFIPGEEAAEGKKAESSLSPGFA
jgi:hypothetical protein